MNIDELEKLARAADSKYDWHPVDDLLNRSITIDVAKYLNAANPDAILELIDSHRKLSGLLGRAFGAIIRDGDGKLLSEAMSALNKANGESNE